MLRARKTRMPHAILAITIQRPYKCVSGALRGRIFKPVPLAFITCTPCAPVQVMNLALKGKEKCKQDECTFGYSPVLWYHIYLLTRRVVLLYYTNIRGKRLLIVTNKRYELAD